MIAITHVLRPLSRRCLPAVVLAVAAWPAAAQVTPVDSVREGSACPAAIAGDDRGELGVVLSGGGARGLAHIGVLRVLDSLGVRPRLVVGTSMGALVGALYAGGLSGAELDALARELPLEPLFRGYAPVTTIVPSELSTPATILTPVFVLEWRDDGLSLRSPVARELQLNALINQVLLHANLVAGGDFDRLPRRYRAVATNVRTDSAMVLRAGDLAEAVRASIAIPVVFAPVQYGDDLLVDGGLSANLPIAEARRSGAGRIVISDVGSPPPDSGVDGSMESMLNYLIDELFTQPLDPLQPGDVRVRPAVREHNPLNFSREAVGALIDQGYEDARRAFAGCRVRPAGAGPALPTPTVADESFVRDRLARLASEGVYETVWLHPRRGEVVAGDTITISTFSPVATLAPERLILGDVAYDAHDGARASLSTAHLAPAGGRIRAGATISASAWRQQGELNLTGLRRHPLPRPDVRDTAPLGIVHLPDPRRDDAPWSTRVRLLLRPELSITGTREIVRLYDTRGRDVERPTARDLVGYAGVGGTPATGWEVAVGAVGHAWSLRTPSRSGDGMFAVGGLVRTARFSAPPVTGPDPNMIPTVAAEAMWLDRYRRVSAHADLRFLVRRLVLRPRGFAGWGEQLPFAAQFPLGGLEGFPGLRTGERRGDRAWFGALAVMHPVAGPLYLRAEAGMGATSFATSREADLLAGVARGWVRGAEAGIMLDTPLGTLVAGYGIASNGRPVVKIRVGS